MKKRILTYLGMVAALFCSFQLAAQTDVLHPATNVSQSYTLNSGANTAFFNYYDNGGAAGAYSNALGNNAAAFVTFNPSGAGFKVQAQFTAFSTESGWDALYVYDGTSLAAPLIASTNAAPAGAPNPFGNAGAGGWYGTVAPNNVTANVVRAQQANGALTFAFDSDGSVTLAGWAATITQVAPCTPVAGADLNVSTDAAVCSATVNVATPASFTPAGCFDATKVLRYSLDNAPAVTLANPVPATLSFSNLAPGTHTIVWTVVTAATGLPEASDTQLINVSDLTPPAVVCPADIEVTLGPGECGAFINYNVTASDNCPFQVPGGTVNHPIDFNNGQAGVMFDVRNLGTGPIVITNFTPSLDAGTWPVQVYYTTTANTCVGSQLTAGAWTLLGTATVTSTGTTPGTLVPVGGLQLAPGQSKGIYVTSTTGFPMNYTNASRTVNDGTLEVDAAPGYGMSFAFGSGFTPRAYNGGVSYDIFLPATNIPVVLTAGVESGGEFLVGTTQNCFEAEDQAGNTGSCCFNVKVNAYPNPTTTLACNNAVQVSLDEDCSSPIGADQVLEGGPYGCYDTRYTVNVLSSTGAMLPGVVNASHIGQTVTVKVTDNVTGQSCWGSVIVEDKLKPVIECRDLVVDCTQNLNDPAILVPAPPLVGPQAIIYEGINDEIGEAGAPVPDIHEYDFDFNYIPAGFPVLDADVRVRLTGHTWLPDLDIVLEAPGGAPSADVFSLTGCFGQEWPIDVTFDDEGQGGLTLCVQLNAAGAALQPVVAPGASGTVLFNVDGVDAHGNWTLRFQDNTAGDDGVIETAGVILTVDAPGVPVLDNCSNELTLANGRLTYVDNYTDGQCGGPSATVTRTWTGTDASGNSASCVQTITVERPTLDDVELPADVQWTCEQYAVFPNVTGASHLHPYISDTDGGTSIVEVNLDPNCDDLDLSAPVQDNPAVNSTNTANGGGGCPGSVFPNNGLDDADVLALTGSGVPTVGGRPLVGACEITFEKEDLTVAVCPGTFKIVRKWTLIDWCSNPVDVRTHNQVIKVVDDEAPVVELFAVAGESSSNYGTSDIPALGNGGGCNQEPQLSGGTQYLAHVQLPVGLTPESYNRVRLASVWVEIDHGRLSDLDIFLRSPLGKVLELSSNNGGAGTSLAADFTDAAALSVTAAGNNIQGDVRPEGSLATSCGGYGATITKVSHFDDINTAPGNPDTAWQQEVLGNWELVVFDEVSQATGKVVSWKLFFEYESINVDVYNASVPQGAGPHAVCAGSVTVQPASAYDNCSGVASYTTELWTVLPNGQPGQQLASVAGNGGVFNNVPLYQNGQNATYTVRYYAVDGCGNQSFVDGRITLRDKVPPVVVCDEITEVSVTNNGQSTGQSCSTLHAESLDDGSYDNCRPVYYLMAKMDDSFSPNIYNRCYYPSRDFCCTDLGDNTVIVLVLDGDPTPFMTTLNNAQLGCDGTPGLFLTQTFSALNYNTCMVTVQVTDKLPPVLVSCPPNQRITCDWYANNLETQLAGLTTPASRTALLASLGFGTATFFDNCAVNITPTFSTNLDQCLEGTITRGWSATDNAGNNGTQTCTQTISVDHVSDWVVEFPNDITVTCGNDVPDFGEPEIFYETCELVAVSYDDQVFTTVPDACYKILRTWTVINWCVVGTNPGLIDQEVAEQPENQLGLVFPQCDLDSDGDCDARTFRDSWRSGTPASTARPSAVDATRSTNPDTDLDTDPWDGYITYQQTIKVVDNVDPVFTNGCAIPDVCIEDNGCTATLLLPVPEITECSEHVTVTAQVKIGGVWLNGFGPYLGVAPGTYEVRYVASDNCNNQTQCLSSVTVRDCKKPTPYCKNGLVIELMQTGMVQTWASDFDAGSFDNCPGTLKLSFSANVNNTGATYDCDDLGQQLVQMWVTDAAGNQDYCETSVIIQANMGQCTDDPQVAGTVATEDAEGVTGVTVGVNSPSGFTASPATSGNGGYSVNVVAGGDYTLTPVLDEDPLNGVSTFDLVLISKHILGVQPLGSPYKVIAADANKSNSVTTFDLVEIRKLILFVNTDFPNNTSWRFVDKGYVFPNASNPFQAQFPEVVNLNDVSAHSLANDFVAVKVGDVNGNAAVNLLGSSDERTTVGGLVLGAEDVEMEAGNEYTVDFRATDFNVSGYQFTLSFDRGSLEFQGIEGGLANEGNFGTSMASEGILTTSWNSDAATRVASGERLFGIRFRALKGGRLSDLVSVDSRYTVAEAYDAASNLLNVGLSFNGGAVAGGGFGLFQNTPNPFAGQTEIGFVLPEAGRATLTVSDAQGRVLKVVAGSYAKGYNRETLKRSELAGASGVLYYRLDSDSGSATRKMVLVD